MKLFVLSTRNLIILFWFGSFPMVEKGKNQFIHSNSLKNFMRLLDCVRRKLFINKLLDFSVNQSWHKYISLHFIQNVLVASWSIFPVVKIYKFKCFQTRYAQRKNRRNRKRSRNLRVQLSERTKKLPQVIGSMIRKELKKERSRENLMTSSQAILRLSFLSFSSEFTFLYPIWFVFFLLFFSFPSLLRFSTKKMHTSLCCS